MIYNKSKNNPYKIVQMFEEEVAAYTGAKFAISVDNCTNAIFLVCKFLEVKEVVIPSKTYLSVPQSIMHAGGEVIFDTTEESNNWNGIYQLKPYPIYDAAKRFTSNMYIPGTYMCLSFHIKKHLKIGKGGMILTDNEDAAIWFKKARYEGRSEKLYHEDDIDMLGWNMYMTPQQASIGLSLLQNYPKYCDDLDENNGYRDLTEFTIFKKNKIITPIVNEDVEKDNTLNELGNKHETDKGSHYGYLNIYESYLKKYRNENINFMEIGVDSGCSIKMWEDYFKVAKIYGVDYIDKKKYESKRTTILKANQEKEEELMLLPNNMDIILDDGGHTMTQQQKTLKTLFNTHLKEGGLYIIEDLHTSVIEFGKACGYMWEATEKNNTLKLLKDLKNGIIPEEYEYFISKEEFNELLENIENIDIHEIKWGSITAIIKKRDKDTPKSIINSNNKHKICFVLDTHYKNYTDRVKKESLKSFLDLKLYELGVDFLISTNNPDNFKEYKNDHIKVFHIDELRYEYPLSLKYEELPENPYGLYPSKFPWNLERFILKKAGEMGYNYVINLDSDVVINSNYTAESLISYLNDIYQENTLMTNQAIFTYENKSPSEVFCFHEQYINHFNLNFEPEQYNSLDGPVLIYMGKTNKDIIRFADTWNELTEFGYEKKFGFGYENTVCGNWSLSIPMSEFKLKWIDLPFTPYHNYSERYVINDEKLSILDVILADKGYYINLISSSDRNDAMINQINKFSIKGLNRFESLTDPFIQYSCTKSHLEVLKDALNQDLNSILVFEDDAQIMEEPNIMNEKFELKSVLNELKNDMDTLDWDVILLGCNPKSYLIPETKLMSKIFKSTGGWAYIIKKDAYKYILDNSNYHSDYIAIDDWLPKLSEFGFNVYATTPIIVHHSKGFVSTLQPKGPVDYTTWINDNYYQFLYEFKKEKSIEEFINEYQFELNTTVIIPGYFCENYLYYLKYVLKSCPEKLLKCKFLIIYDNHMETKNPLELIHYFLNRKSPLNYEILFSKTGVAESMKIALEKVKTKYMIWLEHDAVFLKKDSIDFNNLYNTFEKYDFVNSVWFNTDDNQLRGFEIGGDKNGTETPYEKEQRISEINLVKTVRWSNRPMMLRTTKMKEWFEKYIDNPTIGVVAQGQWNIEDNMIPKYREEVKNNVWEEIKDDWGTYLYGDIGEGPFCGHTDASRRFQELPLRTMAEDNANIYISENPLTEND